MLGWFFITNFADNNVVIENEAVRFFIAGRLVWQQDTESTWFCTKASVVRCEVVAFCGTANWQCFS